MAESIDRNYMGGGIYRENIIDHFQSPRNHGEMQNPDVKHKEFNPLCGDQIEMSLKITDGIIIEIKFIGKGCAISQASTSMLTEFVKNKPLYDAERISKDEIVAMLNIPISPVRLKCALLGLDTLQNAIHIFENYKGGHV